jgi:hypothetical protein
MTCKVWSISPRTNQQDNTKSNFLKVLDDIKGEGGSWPHHGLGESFHQNHHTDEVKGKIRRAYGKITQ